MNKINRKRFDEYFAKVVLEYCYPKRYHDLEVKDKPDLQGKGVGVEVTTCTPKEVAEAFNLWNKALKYGVKPPKKQKDVYLEKGKLIWNQGVYDDSIKNSPLQQFINSVSKKLERLNNKNANYAELNSYELFVNSALDIDTGDLKIRLGILDELQKLNTKIKKFDKIYLLLINKTMIVFDLVNNIFEIMYLYNRLDVLAKKAIKLIREG